jgi:hypothetical protein
MNFRKAILVMSVLAAATATAQTVTAEKTERCATRLSISLLGKSPVAALMSDASPQNQVDAMLQSADFQERFARFVNSTFNDNPGATPSEDSAYYLTKYVLTNGKTWDQMFLGAYKVDLAAGAAATAAPTVTDDPNGLGYFRSKPWMLRYAGNELAGIKISTAYRIMNNVIGLKLVASTNAPGADISQNGRQSSGCRACHFDGWFALDKVASVLSRKVETVTNNVTVVSFGPPPASPQQILGTPTTGIVVNDDKELVSALVNSEAFKFRACRLAFEYLYGRPEVTCEGPVFDRCMTAFKAAGTIQSALASVAKDATFCQ